MNKSSQFRPKDILQEVISYNSLLFSKKQKKLTKFCIFGRGRSGSTLLVNLLAKHPSISCDGEILHRKALFPKQKIDTHVAKCSSEVYGFKLLSYQVRDVQNIKYSEKFLQNLVEAGFYIIYLRRKNLLFHALSNINARQKSNFHIHDNNQSYNRNAIHVDCNEVIQWMKGSESLEIYEKYLLINIPHLSLYYEDDLLNPECHQITADRVFNYLQIPSVQVSSNLVKLMPLQLNQMVLNSEELRQSVSRTKFSHFLPD
jgi:LPS sulfotransferase NodH